MASIDTHIKFDGIEGESTHTDHKGEIEIISWQWGLNNMNAGATSGGGSGKGKATPGDFSFRHVYDKASPVLAKRCADGKHFGKVTLTARKSGEGQKDFLKIEFTEVFIIAVNPSGSQGGDIIENVSFSYAQVDFTYKPQETGGGLGGDVKFGWNNKTTVIT